MSENTIHAATRRHWVLIACMLSMFMAAIEVTIVATAMPTIITELGGFSQFGWVFSIYLLTQAVTVPIYGRLADMWGRKRVFFIGAGLFLLGSVLCGFASSMTWLIIFRAFQGLGAGAIMPLTSIIIADVYPPKERASIQGWLSSVWGVAAIVGPLTGAWLVQHFNWALIFWVNVPIGIISMLLLVRFFPENPQRSAHRLNLAGSFWLMVTVTALLMALLQTEALGYWALALIALALCSGWILFRHERHSGEPLFPLDIWRTRTLLAGNLGNLFIGAAMMGISAFLPTWVQGVNGGSPLQAGSALAMMSIGWPLASTFSGRLMQWTSYRFTALLGSVLLVTGTALLLFLQQNSPAWYAGFSAFVIGTGMGMTSTTFLIAVQNTAKFEIRGICTASVMFSRMLGSALGTAIMGAVLNYNLLIRLPQFHDPVQQVMSHEGRQQLTAENLQWMLAEIAHSLHWVFAASLIIALGSLVISRLVPALKPH